MAALLSQNKGIGLVREIPKSRSRKSIQNISRVACAMDLYYDSAEDLETTDCFLEGQDIMELPRKEQKPVTDRRVSEHVHQSASTKILGSSDEVAEQNRPKPAMPLRYLKIL